MDNSKTRFTENVDMLNRCIACNQNGRYVFIEFVTYVRYTIQAIFCAQTPITENQIRNIFKVA